MLLRVVKGLLNTRITFKIEYYYCKCMLEHKCINGPAPHYLLSDFQHASDEYNIGVRTRDLVRLPLAITKKIQGSFSYSRRRHGTRFLGL